MDIRLYTVGYGNRKVPEFIELLKTNGINHVFDVRRKGSGAWYNSYCWGPRMLKTCSLAGCAYTEWDFLGNYADEVPTGYSQFDSYRRWLETGAGKKAVKRAAWVLYSGIKILQGSKKVEDEVPCLLCAEKDHSRCHRSLVAEAIRQKLVEFPDVQVSVEHL